VALLIDKPLLQFVNGSYKPGFCVDAKGDLVVLGLNNNNLIPGSIEHFCTTYTYASDFRSINIERINNTILSFSRINSDFRAMFKSAYPNLKVGYCHNLYCGKRTEDISTIMSGVSAYEKLLRTNRFDEAEKVYKGLTKAGCSLIPKTKISIHNFHLFPCGSRNIRDYKIIENGWYVSDRILKPAICSIL